MRAWITETYQIRIRKKTRYKIEWNIQFAAAGLLDGPLFFTLEYLAFLMLIFAFRFAASGQNTSPSEIYAEIPSGNRQRQSSVPPPP